MRELIFTVLVTLFLGTLTVSAQESNEAEQLFQKMQVTLERAKAIELSFTIAVEEPVAQVQKGTRFTGTLSTTSGNKGRIEMSGKDADGGDLLNFVGISDGSQAVVIVGREVAPELAKTPKNYTATYVTLIARSGILMSIMPLLPEVSGKEEIDYRDLFSVSDFKLGKQEDIGGRKTQQVQYVLGVKGQKRNFPVTLWSDVTTGLPVKRRVGSMYTENYELKLEGNLDPKQFELPLTQLPQQQFEGEWINVDDVAFTAKRLVVSKGDHACFVEAFAVTIMIVDGIPKEAEVSLGKANLSLAGDSPDAKTLPFGFMKRDLKESVQYSILRIEEAQMVVETFTIFPNKVGNPNYRTVEKFERK
jgi:outer membrane lipoprotein-sorting protein